MMKWKTSPSVRRPTPYRHFKTREGRLEELDEIICKVLVKVLLEEDFKARMLNKNSFIRTSEGCT